MNSYTVNAKDAHWLISALCGCSLVQKHVLLMLIGSRIAWVGPGTVTIFKACSVKRMRFGLLGVECR